MDGGRAQLPAAKLAPERPAGTGAGGSGVGAGGSGVGAGGSGVYVATLEHLFARSGAGMELGLETVRELLAELGDPHRGPKAPVFVSVAGTNGKGSTSAMIADAMRAAGHRVGLYTSPHVLRFTERIRVDGREIERGRAAELYERICAVEGRCRRLPTFFECVTAMALCEFAEQGCEVAVLEVGLGGRLDATRAANAPVAVLTPIDLDHQEILGETVEAIAAEKAAIIAEGGTVVVGDQRPSARAVIDAVAAERRAMVVEAACSTLDPTGTRLTLDAGGVAGRAEVALGERPLATYQHRNIATAWAACRALDLRTGVGCSAADLARAVTELRWPGRYEWLADDVLVDAAHNPAGIAALLDSIARDPRTRRPAGEPRPMHAVFSALRDKPGELLAAALRARGELYLCPIPIRRGRNAEQLRALAPDAPVYPSAAAALTDARAAAARDGGFVLVAGSIFLLAEALPELTGEPRDPSIPF